MACWRQAAEKLGQDEPLSIEREAHGPVHLRKAFATFEHSGADRQARRKEYSRVIGEERKNLMDLLVFVVVLLAFAEAAARWGADSSERINSHEWKRRLQSGCFL